VAPSGFRLGLLAPSVDTVLRKMGFDDDLEMYDQVMWLGSQVGKILNRKLEESSE
jgi:hypothetical protein